MGDFWVNGIVAQRDKQPYVQLSNEKGMIAQLTMAQARNIAMDILNMCARTECDAMLHHFFAKMDLPQASAPFMMEFREFRAQLDREKVERSMQDPDTGEIK